MEFSIFVIVNLLLAGLVFVLLFIFFIFIFLALEKWVEVGDRCQCGFPI